MRPGNLTVALVAIAVAGCDPAAGIRVRSNLRPAPIAGCIDSALARSLLLAGVDPLKQDRFARKRGEREFRAFFRDGATPHGVGNLAVLTLGDSVASVTLDFVWIGSIRNVPDTTRRWLATQGMALVRDLHAACAPQSPDTVRCEQRQALGKRPPPCGTPDA